MEETRIVHDIASEIVPLVIGVTLIICLMRVVISILKFLKQRANLKSKTDLYNRMIDKFGAAPEFVAYLQSDEGRQFIDENIVQSTSPLSKILLSIQIGVILTLLGIGLLVLGNIFGGSLGGDLYIVLTVSGTVGAMVGIGFLISAGISYKLCKIWGLLTLKEKAQAVEN